MENIPKNTQARRILLGTSGYSYRDWIGPVYPVGTVEKDFLELYATHFNVAELNFSYYTQPQASLLKKMLETTPDQFLFVIKAHKSLTHKFEGNLLEDIARFKKGVDPLLESGRLAAVLFQFPFSFHYENPSRVYLDKICRAFENYPVAVEFRNLEWQRASVYKEFTNRRLTFVNVDIPDLPRLPKSDVVHTSSFSYIRFHGRNKVNWWKGDNVTRYDYLYSSQELATWIPKIFQILEKVKLLLLIFNNHYKGQSFKNAQELRELLKKQGVQHVE